MKQDTSPELEAWMAERHNPNWVPGRNGGRIVRRKPNGQFAKGWKR